MGVAPIDTFRYAGLRLTELVTLPTDDVNLDDRRISVIGKGSKQRVVPMPPVLANTLVDYLDNLRPDLPKSKYLFANPASPKKSTFYGSYCPRVVQDLVREAGENADIPGRHFPHRWRHSYATSLLRRGVDIHVVQRLLGHSSITTTTRYRHLDDDDLAHAVDVAFPCPSQDDGE